MLPAIVITGGPASGKTTALEYLKVKYPDLYAIDEVGFQVFAAGFPLPSAANPWTQAWQDSFQAAVAAKQLETEAMAQQQTQATLQRAIVQDRGLLDGAGYLAAGVPGLEHLVGNSYHDMLSRYHAVIYLSGAFENATNNPYRFEEQTRARTVSRKILKSWRPHPRLTIVRAKHNRHLIVAELIQGVLKNT